MNLTVHELASPLNLVLLSYQPRQTVKRVLEFEKIFDRYLKNNPSLADRSLLEQLRSWLEVAQPHYEEFQWLQFYLIIWLDKKGEGNIKISQLQKIFADTINDYKQSDLALRNYQNIFSWSRTWKPFKNEGLHSLNCSCHSVFAIPVKTVPTVVFFISGCDVEKISAILAYDFKQSPN